MENGKFRMIYYIRSVSCQGSAGESSGLPCRSASRQRKPGLWETPQGTLYHREASSWRTYAKVCKDQTCRTIAHRWPPPDIAVHRPSGLSVVVKELGNAVKSNTGREALRFLVTVRLAPFDLLGIKPHRVAAFLFSMLRIFGF
jgi:hypothetical protein